MSRQPLGYVPALDGLRALSVCAVIAYHAGWSALPGGYLGVEVFFVISGFLITTLMLEERESSGRVSLRQFWIRRFRRLMPALATMLVATLIAVTFVWTDAAPEFRRDVLASVFYVSNWWQIFGVDVPYFGTGSLPVLRHLWSLAVEEQWYLVWPLVFVALIGRAKVRRIQLGILVAVLSVVAMVLTAVAFVPDDETRTNLLYLGTHTRSSGILAGAALALLWSSRSDGASKRRIVDVSMTFFSLTSIALVAFLMATLHVEDGELYRGGLAATSLVTVVVIAAVIRRNSGLVGEVFSLPILVAIGRRSYGLYLWHWPIFVVLDARESTPELLLAAVVTIVLNELTYRFVELPVRGEAAGRLRASWPNFSRMRRRLITSIGVLVVATVIGSTVQLTGIQARDVSIDQGNTDVVFVAPSTVPPTTVPGVSTTSTTLAKLPRRVVIVGDSQAHSLYVNRPSGLEETFQLSNGSIDGCGVYDRGVGVGGRNDRFRRNFANCEGFQEKWAKSATTARADVALVVIGAWEVLDIEVGKLRFVMNSVPADTLFMAQLRKGIDALLATKTPVAILEIPCMRPVDSKGGPVPALKERGDDLRTGHLNKLIKQVVETYTSQVTFVEGPNEWCESAKISSSLSYRWDGVHVYKPGAKLILETVADDLLAIPVRNRK